MMDHPNQQTLLAKAFQQTAHGGFDSLSLRGMAAVLEVSEDELKRHYPDRIALRAALIAESREQLIRALTHAISEEAETSSLLRFAEAYLRFAKENLVVFDLWRDDFMHSFDRRGSTPFWRLLYTNMGRMDSNTQSDELALAFFALLNGLVSIQISFGGNDSILGQSLRSTTTLFLARKR